MHNPDIFEGSPPAQSFPAIASPVKPLNDLVPDFFFEYGLPSPNTSILSRTRNLSISDYNVKPDFRPSRCISPLRLAEAVSTQNDYSTMFNKKLSSPQRTIISFLSNQNQGFEEISRGSKDKAEQIFQGLGYTANFFEKVCRCIPSSSSSPSDSQTQNLNLMMP